MALESVDSCLICAWEHLGDAEQQLMEAGSAPLGSTRQRQKLLGAADAVYQAERRHLVPRFDDLAIEARNLRKSVEKSYFAPKPNLVPLFQKIGELRNKIWMLYEKEKCPTCIITPNIAHSPLPQPANGKKLNTKLTFTHVVGERKMAKPIEVATNALVSFVSGTGGTALHFIGFKTLTGTQLGVPTRSLADIAVGLVSVVASTMWEDGPDWLRTVLMLVGGTLMGLGVAEWAGWQPPAPAPVLRGARPGAARPPVRQVPAAPLIF